MHFTLRTSSPRAIRNFVFEFRVWGHAIPICIFALVITCNKYFSTWPWECRLRLDAMTLRVCLTGSEWSGSTSSEPVNPLSCSNFSHCSGVYSGPRCRSASCARHQPGRVPHIPFDVTLSVFVTSTRTNQPPGLSRDFTCLSVLVRSAVA